MYRTTVKNEVEQDPVDLQYYQTGRKQVQGIELGVTGEVARNWLASAGYTRMDTRSRSGQGGHRQRHQQPELHAEAGLHRVDLVHPADAA